MTEHFRQAMRAKDWDPLIDELDHLEVQVQPAENNDDVEPERYNDAELLGVEPEGFEDILSRPVTFLTGELWGAKDRRNTQDGQWNAVTMPLSAWMIGGAKQGGAPAWGFTRHPVGKHKEGACVVLGSSIDGARKAKAMIEMHAMGLDVDSGARLDDVLAILEEKGIFAIVYTSFNHGKSGLALKRDDVLRKLQIDRDPTDQEMRIYLAQHYKDRFEEDFIAQCTITEQKSHSKDGMKILVDTPPLDKFRLIFPLAEPVKPMELGNTDAESLEMWENAVTGLARNTLGVHFDTSCTDPSRLFYTARHPKDSEDWYCAVVRGYPLRFEDIEPMRKSSYTSKRDVNAFLEAAGDDGRDDLPPMALTPSGASLNEWHRSAKERFLLADLMEDMCSDKIRRSGGEAQGTVHTECPFEHDHSSEGGTATMAVNALDSESGYWTWFCHHDACQGRHKLEFLEEALRAEWFEESLLFDEVQGYILPAEDKLEDVVDRQQQLSDELVEKAEAFTKNTVEAEIDDLVQVALTAGADSTTKQRVADAVVRQTSMGKRDFNKLWKSAETFRRIRKQNAAGKIGDQAVVNSWDYSRQCEYARAQIINANKKDPFLFHLVDGMVSVRRGDGSIIRISSKDKFFPYLKNVTSFVRVNEDGEVTREVAPPDDVVRYLFNAPDVKDDLPELVQVRTAPFFSSEGKLVSSDGYDPVSKTYLALGGFKMARVSAEPSLEEIAEAKRLIIEEVLADFPLGGCSREEILRRGLHNEGDAIPTLANAIALMLLPFVREMIPGPTPGHMFNKPLPGTGASLLMDVLSIVATGKPAPSMALPSREEEITKTLLAILRNGDTFLYFDNVNHKIDSGSLAQAMTSTTLQGRVLGVSDTVDAPVRGVWVFTANTAMMSPELARRCILVALDARTSKPSHRNGFRHAHIKDWVKSNRANLVHACLTLIQHWVAKGCPQGESRPLASFEAWSGVLGGILSEAGIRGLLENQSEMEDLSNSGEDGVSILMQALAEKMHKLGEGALLVTGRLPDNAVATVSAMDTLNEMEDQPRLHHWGYREEDEGVRYTDPIRLGMRFRNAAKSPYRVDLDGTVYEAMFEEASKKTRNRSKQYKMRLSALVEAETLSPEGT